MKSRIKLIKASFVVMFLIAGLHTFFVIIGGPPLPETPEFRKMRELMKSILVDSGGGVMRSTQNFMDGFNIIISIFLITLPLLAWITLSAIKENAVALRRMTIVVLFSESAFFITSLTLLAIGGTLLSGIACVLLLISLPSLGMIIPTNNIRKIHPHPLLTRREKGA